MTQQVELGQVVATAGVAEWAADKSSQVSASVRRHQSGDWGEVCDEDKSQNEWASKEGERLLSQYTIEGRRIWIITERDRSVTTILFPEEY